MRLEAVRIPHEKQRYDTVGDYYVTKEWFVGGDNYIFRISDLGDWRKEAAVFLHEFVEAMLAKQRGITIEQIDAWDLAHPDADEPGSVEGCPYFREHTFAEVMERVFVHELGLTWAEHEEAIERASSGSRSERPDGSDGGVRPEGSGLPVIGDRQLPAQPGEVGAREGPGFVDDD